MKRIAFCLALVSLLALGGSAFAELGTIDDVPGATLLLPYFETEWANPNGINTLFSINNASSSAVLAHVTLWTDESIPTLDFDIYLTGFDVQTLNLRDIFNGNLPRTAVPSVDAGDASSPSPPRGATQSAAPREFNFPGTTGPCLQPYPLTNALGAELTAHIRAAHTGRFSGLYEGCLGAFYGDNIARGYITVDTVNQCNLSFPCDQGYFSTFATNQNVLWGDYFYVNTGENFAQGETLVHIEACPIEPPAVVPDPPGFPSPTTGSAAVAAELALCPMDITQGEYTFYGRYVPTATQDQREGLASVFAARYVNGGGFDGGTDFIVWRDSKVNVCTDVHSCPGSFDWFPLGQTLVVAFDEQENSTRLCTRTGNISPPPRDVPSCLPWETQRVPTHGPSIVPLSEALNTPYDFGWTFLNLNHNLLVGDPFPERAQAWVTVVMDALGRFSVGFDAIQLNNVTTVTGATRTVPTIIISE